MVVTSSIRGGISMISNRYGKANNKYLPDYDPTQESSYILPLDANNLYGWAMVQPLPERQFDWLNEDQKAAFDVMQIEDESEMGYILEVDLEYPAQLHNDHSDYPLAPESMTVTPDMLSPYSIELLEKLNMKPCKVQKLVPNLNNKQKYVVHYINWKLYLKYGLKLTKIHRILEFKLSPWMKPYIMFNTEMRKQAKNSFEKDFSN